MINESNFIVRASGRKAGCYYLDYSGIYKTNEIAAIFGIDPVLVIEKYQDNGAVFNEELGVYYFDEYQKAIQAIKDIIGPLNNAQRGKVIYLSESEIELIRKALINEGGNLLSSNSNLKASIFKKLNN